MAQPGKQDQRRNSRATAASSRESADPSKASARPPRDDEPIDLTGEDDDAQHYQHPTTPGYGGFQNYQQPTPGYTQHYQQPIPGSGARPLPLDQPQRDPHPPAEQICIDRQCIRRATHQAMLGGTATAHLVCGTHLSVVTARLNAGRDPRGTQRRSPTTQSIDPADPALLAPKQVCAVLQCNQQATHPAMLNGIVTAHLVCLQHLEHKFHCSTAGCDLYGLPSEVGPDNPNGGHLCLEHSGKLQPHKLQKAKDRLAPPMLKLRTASLVNNTSMLSPLSPAFYPTTLERNNGQLSSSRSLQPTDEQVSPAAPHDWRERKPDRSVVAIPRGPRQQSESWPTGYPFRWTQDHYQFQNLAFSPGDCGYIIEVNKQSRTYYVRHLGTNQTGFIHATKLSDEDIGTYRRLEEPMWTYVCVPRLEPLIFTANFSHASPFAAYVYESLTAWFTKADALPTNISYVKPLLDTHNKRMDVQRSILQGVKAAGLDTPFTQHKITFDNILREATSVKPEEGASLLQGRRGTYCKIDEEFSDWPLPLDLGLPDVELRLLKVGYTGKTQVSFWERMYGSHGHYILTMKGGNEDAVNPNHYGVSVKAKKHVMYILCVLDDPRVQPLAEQLFTGANDTYHPAVVDGMMLDDADAIGNSALDASTSSDNPLERSTKVGINHIKCAQLMRQIDRQVREKTGFQNGVAQPVQRGLNVSSPIAEGHFQKAPFFRTIDRSGVENYRRYAAVSQVSKHYAYDKSGKTVTFDKAGGKPATTDNPLRLHSFSMYMIGDLPDDLPANLDLVVSFRPLCDQSVPLVLLPRYNPFHGNSWLCVSRGLAVSFEFELDGTAYAIPIQIPFLEGNNDEFAGGTGIERAPQERFDQGLALLRFLHQLKVSSRSKTPGTSYIDYGLADLFTLSRDDTERCHVVTEETGSTIVNLPEHKTLEEMAAELEELGLPSLQTALDNNSDTTVCDTCRHSEGSGCDCQSGSLQCSFCTAYMRPCTFGGDEETVVKWLFPPPIVKQKVHKLGPRTGVVDLGE